MPELFSVDNDAIILEVSISLMMGQVESIEIVVEFNRVPACNFMPIPQRFIIWKTQFSQMHQGKEAS